MKYGVLFFLLVTLSSCVLQSRETLAEVEFENAHLGLEYIPDPSLEGYNTTLHVFYQPQGEDNRKYIYEPKDGFRFNVFPRDIKILKGIKFSVIDTVARNIGSYKPTEANTTLYVDPSLITEKSWEIFNRFVQQSYQKPDSSNQFLCWMNKAYNKEDKPDSLYFIHTLYALVYASLDSLELQFVSVSGTESVKLGVDHMVYFKNGKDEVPIWVNVGHLYDSVFYYSSLWEDANAKKLGDYAKAGKRFGSLYRSMSVEQ